jgi:hypothetical protein
MSTLEETMKANEEKKKRQEAERLKKQQKLAKDVKDGKYRG